MNVWDCQQVLTCKQVGLKPVYSLKFFALKKESFSSGLALPLLLERTERGVLEGV